MTVDQGVARLRGVRAGVWLCATFLAATAVAQDAGALKSRRGNFTSKGTTRRQ